MAPDAKYVAEIMADVSHYGVMHNKKSITGVWF